MNHSKIAVIGAGAVGSTTAYALMLKNIAAEIMLVDVDEERCKGEILDLSDALSFSKTSVIRHATSQEAGQADIIIITAGARQKPDQDRVALIETNKKVIYSIIENISPIQKNALILMVTNPLDILLLCAQEHAGLPRKQVFGSGTFLDTQRLRGIIAKKLNVAQQSINAYILGEHGDTQFAAWSSAQVGGIPLSDFPALTSKDLQEIEQETRQKAYEIISCKGATFFGIAACVTKICEAIIFNQKLVLPLSCYIDSLEVCLSMPVVLGQNGIEQIFSIPLNEQEQTKLNHSAHYLKRIKKQCFSK